MTQISLFALHSCRSYGETIAARLKIPLAAHEERDFEDGEHKIRPLESVRGRHVFVLADLYSDPNLSVNDKLLRLIMFLGALRDASAQEITLIAPYLPYARKDRRTQPRDPVSLRYLATVLEAAGTDRVIVLDVHNPAAFQNAFRRVTEHLEAIPLFIGLLQSELEEKTPITVVSPDTGGFKRAEKFRQALAMGLQKEINSAFVEKLRSGGKLQHGRLVGSVGSGTVLIVDDMIVSGSTVCYAAQTCKQQGAAQVFALATHGIFSAAANALLTEPALDRVIITDTVRPWRLTEGQALNKITVLETGELLAKVIERIVTGGSITELMSPKVT